MRTLVIEFPQAEDHEWALKQITRQIAKGNGNQLAGGSASILLCALSRAAHVADLGDVPPAVEAQAARIRDLVSENVKLRAACERADHLVKEMEMAFDDVPAGVDAHLAMTRTALKAALATTANKPNANLIASAPELLEALRDVANDYETAGCDGCGTISERAMRVVLTAIAKAEGVTT